MKCISPSQGKENDICFFFKIKVYFPVNDTSYKSKTLPRKAASAVTSMAFGVGFLGLL
jgi:hypothetical protein